MFDTLKQKIHNRKMALRLSLLAFLATRGVKMNDAGTDDVGAGIVKILIVVLLFGALAPSIGSGLNATVAAFSTFTGVSGVVNAIPIILVVGLLYVAYTFMTRHSDGKF